MALYFTAPSEMKTALRTTLIPTVSLMRVQRILQLWLKRKEIANIKEKDHSIRSYTPFLVRNFSYRCRLTRPEVRLWCNNNQKRHLYARQKTTNVHNLVIKIHSQGHFMQHKLVSINTNNCGQIKWCSSSVQYIIRYKSDQLQYKIELEKLKRNNDFSNVSCNVQSFVRTSKCPLKFDHPLLVYSWYK